jgi:hypothetical protein
MRRNLLNTISFFILFFCFSAMAAFAGRLDTQMWPVVNSELQHTTETLNADRTILIRDNPVLWFDCNGTSRNVTLPAETTSKNLVFTILNISDAAGEDLVIMDDTPTTLITIGPGQGTRISCDATNWRVLNNFGIEYDAAAGLFTVGRDTDGYVSLFLERRYAGKYDWLLKAGSRFEIYGGDGNGTLPTDLRFRINDDGSVDMFAGLSVTGPILASTYFNAVDGYVFEGGQTGDTWFWMGQTSDNEADDDDLLYLGKGNSIGTGSFMSFDGDGNLDSNGTASFAGMYMQSITGKRTASAVDYNPSALTSDYIIAITNTDAARAVVISTEDVASGSATQPRLFKIVDQSLGAAAHNITITLENGGTINGAASFVLNQNGQAQDLYVDGSDATLH